VKPAARRKAVQHIRANFPVSERRACAVVGQHRSSQQYRSCSERDDALRAALKAAAIRQPRWGYRRLWWLIDSEGMAVGKTRLQRVYREEKLQVFQRKRKRMVARTRVPAPLPTGKNQQWAMDFVHDATVNKQSFRTLTVIDVFSRECLALEVDRSLPGHRVVRVLNRLIAERGQPVGITCDNGPEFAGLRVNAWAKSKGIGLDFIDPGKPTQNCYCEIFNGSFRDECLNQEIFENLEEAVGVIGTFRHTYNHHRPHSSLNQQTPAAFAAQFDMKLSNQLEACLPQ
jgi:putative transposase